MTSISWNAEGGTDTVTITTGNSGGTSGTAWDTVSAPAGGTVVYDASTVLNGAMSARGATAGTAGTVVNGWSTALQALWPGGMTTHYERGYIRFAALPAGNRIVAQWTDTTGATNRGNLLLLTTGALRLRNAANGTVVTMTTLMSVDTTYRYELRADGSTTGAYELHLHLGNSATALESIVGGTANFGGTIGVYTTGWLTSAASQGNRWWDGIQLNDTGLPGPETSGTPATVTCTAGAARATSTQATATAAVTVSPTTGGARATGTQASATAAAQVDTAAGAARLAGTESVTSAAATVSPTADAIRMAGTISQATAASTLTPTAGAIRCAGTQSTVVTGGTVVAIETTAGAIRALGGRACSRVGQLVDRPSTGTVYRPDSGLVCRP